MKLTKMQKNFEVSNYFLFRYNLKFEDMGQISIEDIEFDFPN